MNNVTELKQQAAEYAVQFVKPGMVVGLGHGSTAIWAVRRIAELLKTGELDDVVCVPCSLQVQADARKLEIPLTTLEDAPVIDITIDGADEIDADFNVIKGGGGALLREKIVAQATKREIVVADASKVSSALGTNFAVPVEVSQFGWMLQMTFLEGLGARCKRRPHPEGFPFLTDQRNFIVDCEFGPIADVHALARAMNDRAGIVEHGLFLNLVHDIVVAGPEGITHRTKS
ncbi:MAG: ribose-5-phosphate isomerase RpiA [FCB group bacterium]|nr:ribose-5-phosphate isomerase RpiA [FCB group bacterium]